MLAFVAAAVIIELTPGPNMTWLAVLGATHGRLAAVYAVAGIALGLGFSGLVAALGLTVLFESFPSLLTGLRYAGTFYLLYLALEAWRDAASFTPAEDGTNRAYFTQGLVSNALNPKAYLFYAAVLPQFLTGSLNERSEIALLTAVYVAIATAIHAIIGLVAGSSANWFVTAPNAKTLRRVLALAIALAAIWFFISTGRMQ